MDTQFGIIFVFSYLFMVNCYDEGQFEYYKKLIQDGIEKTKSFQAPTSAEEYKPQVEGEKGELI